MQEAGQSLEVIEGLNYAAIYLVSLLMAEQRLSSPFLISRYSEIYASLTHGLIRFNHSAPIMRALLGCLKAFLHAMSAEDWKERSSLLELVSHLVRLVEDGRPKVRRLAQEIIASLAHVEQVLSPFLQRGRLALVESTKREHGKALCWLPLLLRSLGQCGQSEVDSLLGPLLHAAGLAAPPLTQGSLACIRQLLRGPLKVPLNQSQARKAVEGVLRLPLSPASLPVLAQAIGEASVPVELCERCLAHLLPTHLPSDLADLLCQLSLELSNEAMAQIWPLCLNWLMTHSEQTAPNQALLTALSLLRECLTRDGCQLPVEKALLSRLAVWHEAASWRSQRLPLQTILGLLIARWGPEVCVEVLPVAQNTWILPLLKESIKEASLSPFMETFIPLSRSLLGEAAQLHGKGLVAEGRSRETVAWQLWSCLPAFMQKPRDLAEHWSQLAPILGSLLNADSLMPLVPESIFTPISVGLIRPLICTALTRFIREAQDADAFEVSNISLALVAEQATQFLPLLFNIYGSTDPERRGHLLHCIQVYLSIADVQLVRSFLQRVMHRLSSGGGVTKLEAGEAGSLLDLASVMLASGQGETEAENLQLGLAAIGLLKECRDTGLRKRCYKTLHLCLADERHGPKLIEEHWSAWSDLLQQQQVTEEGAIKKGRFRLLLSMAPMWPQECLEEISSLLPEVILGTKEVNRKARLYAFELIVAWGRRMEMSNRLSDYWMMVVAGLAGRTPMMLSATIMALARLLFELGSAIDGEQIQQLIEDVIVLIGHPAREVARSAVGLLKVAIPTLPVEQLQPHLSNLVPAILAWANEHALGLRVRVRHLMERLVRRFGWDLIHSLTPAEHQRLTLNIRRRRNRQQRQQQQQQQQQKTPEIQQDNWDDLTVSALSQSTAFQRGNINVVQKSAVTSSARFEKVLYDSDSDLGTDDDDDEVEVGQSMVDDGDEMELDAQLSQKLSLAKSASVKTKKLQKQEQRNKPKKEYYATSQDGRLIIQDSDDEPNDDDDTALVDHDHGEVLEHVRRKRKFKYEEENEEEEDSADDDDARSQVSKVSRFSKTSRKGKGDSNKKKGKFEPYAYVPMGKKQKGGGKQQKQRYFLK